jgi:hypothetical protein
MNVRTGILSEAGPLDQTGGHGERPALRAHTREPGRVHYVTVGRDGNPNRQK